MYLPISLLTLALVSIPSTYGFSGRTLRIMPLGASITYGSKSSNGNGYRCELYKLLAKAGNVVNMVGTQHSGTCEDNASEGHPGFEIGPVTNIAKKVLPEYKPNVVLILVGTNDMKSTNPKTVKAAPESLGKLIDLVFEDLPKTAVLVSTLPPNSDKKVNENIKEFNAAIPEVVKKRAEKGKHVLMVDSHKVVAVKDLADGTHPDDKGYDAIAHVWFEGLKKAAKRKWLDDKPGHISDKLRSYRRANQERREQIYRADLYGF